MRDLKLRDINIEESLFFPRMNTIPNTTWNGSKTAHNEVNKKYNDFLHDYTMLRGSLHPKIEKKLHLTYGPFWRLNRIYQGRANTMSEPINHFLNRSILDHRLHM